MATLNALPQNKIQSTVDVSKNLLNCIFLAKKKIILTYGIAKSKLLLHFKIILSHYVVTLYFNYYHFSSCKH